MNYSWGALQPLDTQIRQEHRVFTPAELTLLRPSNSVRLFFFPPLFHAGTGADLSYFYDELLHPKF